MKSPSAFVLAIFATTSAGCSSPQRVPDAAGFNVHEHMKEHFVRVDKMKTAIFEGDLPASKVQAQWIVDHALTPAVDNRWAVHLEHLIDAASYTAQAPDLAQASEGTARVAGACGSCHETYNANLATKITETQAAGSDISDHMNRHLWATNRMWDAVVAHAPALWVEGAAALQEAPLSMEQLPPGKDPKLVEELAANTHQLGAEAKAVTSWAGRAEILGDLLAQCSSCHDAVGATMIP